MDYRKTKKKNSKLDTAHKELAASNAKVAEMSGLLEKAHETILSLQATLSASKNNSVEVNSLQFGSDIGHSSTQHNGNGGGEPTMEVSRFMSSVNQISISTVNVPECKSSVEGEEIGKFEFETWKDLLIDSMTLAGITEEPTQFIVFKVKAGSKLMEIYKNTKTTADAPDPESHPFTNAMYRLKTYFGSGSDIMLQRRKLALMVQKPDESDLAFIMRVGAMARMCDFSAEKEFEETVSAVAEHARNKEVRTVALKMLSRKGTLTDLIDKVREIQAVNLNEEYYRLRHGTVEAAPVAAVRVGEGRSHRQDFTRNATSRGRFGSHQYQRRDERIQSRPGTSSGKTTEGGRCFRCNSMFHSPDDCWAKGENCLKCGHEGHYKRACKTFIRTGSKRVGDADNANVDAKRIAMVTQEGNAKEEEKPAEDDVGANKY